MTTRLGCLLALAVLAAPSSARAANWAVGASPGTIAGLRAQLPGATTLVPGRALLVHGRRPRPKGATYVENLDALDRQVAFDNNEPLGPEQWYLNEDDAWTYWPAPPDLPTVKVAVIDTGIDADHPEFVGRIAAGVSFVGGSWRTDGCGHGTFVAGLIAANPFNGVGIAGLAFNAKLLIAKVARSDCDVSTTGEIEGIVWAVRHGARVINISLGGNRDPQDAAIDEYDPAEEAAIEYAVSKDVLVVAASGNATTAPSMPWPYADYPAALPHVLGVGAVTQSGAVPSYSDRDRLFVDMVAPGGPLISTIPRSMVDSSLPGCSGMAYSNCGPPEFQDAIGTSFAAPQVAAAAALLFGSDPKLTAAQVEWLLERSATDAKPSTGCAQCSAGRDSLSGWGMLNVAAALRLLGNGRSLPAPDAYEPNDNADTPGASAHPLGRLRKIVATLDYWDDPIDVYSIHLSAGSRFYARLVAAPATRTTLVLWKPGTTDVTLPARSLLSERAATATAVSGQQRIAYSVPVSGKYYIEAKIGAPNYYPDRYTLSVSVGGPGAANS